MKYLIKSLKWTKHYGNETWYAPNSNGYTHDICRAGIYTEEDMERMQDVISEKVIKFIPVSERLKNKGVKQLVNRINQYKFDIARAQKTIDDSNEQITYIKALIESFKNTFPS